MNWYGVQRMSNAGYEYIVGGLYKIKPEQIVTVKRNQQFVTLNGDDYVMIIGIIAYEWDCVRYSVRTRLGNCEMVVYNTYYAYELPMRVISIP